jgi:hypothetical protein
MGRVLLRPRVVSPHPVDAKMNRRILPLAIAEYVLLIRINGSRYSVCEKR